MNIPNETKILIVTIPIAFTTAYFSEVALAAIILNTLFIVQGIFFSVGLSLIFTMDFSGIKNTAWLRELRKNSHRIRDNFIEYFVTATILYLIPFLFKTSFLYVFSVTCMILIGAYYIYNFIEIQKFKYEIQDRVLKEKCAGEGESK